MDESCRQNIRELDHQSVVANIDHVRAKNLWVARFQLSLKELQRLHSDRLDLGLCGRALRRREMGSNRFYFVHVNFRLMVMVGTPRRAASPARTVRSAPPIDLTQSAMGDQIGIAPDRAREMQVIRLCQAVMSKWLRRVTGALQALKQSDFQCLLLGLAANGCQKTLDLGAMRKIAYFVVKTDHEL